MRHLVAHTVAAVLTVLLRRESFKNMIEYTPQTAANQFLISI